MFYDAKSTEIMYVSIQKYLNILSIYKSESPMRDTGWRSQELKDKAIELRLKGNSLLKISTLFRVDVV